MNTPTTKVEEMLASARELSAIERVRLAEGILADLARDLTPEPHPRKSVRGLWAGLHISEEDIAEARREMWGNFPREDI